jgi:hypothetical protein
MIRWAKVHRWRLGVRPGAGAPWSSAGAGVKSESGDDWNLSVRGEQPEQRADRNFIELLQELRVLQTGVQILFALLLTVAFTETFERADLFQRTVYVITLVCCAVATALLMAPVAYHRALFQRGRKADLVVAAHRLLQAGMVVLAAAVIGSLMLVIDQVAGRVTGLLVAPLLGAVFVVLWFVLPGFTRRAGQDPEPRR